MDPILDDLNPAQRDAVLFGDGPLMVLAGAGTGKTRVITRRIAHLLREDVEPAAILALTFTNKAAGEMARRVEELGGHRVRVATFHSACARFLRSSAHHIGYPRDYSIYDTYDRDTCIRGLMAELAAGESAVRPNQVGQFISRLKNQRIRPDGYSPGMSPLDQIVERVYRPYEARMRQLGAMDFDDLLLRFLDLLESIPEVAERYRRRFRHLLVDEFQDTNRVQYDLTRALLGESRNICVVGDPDQSIYSFRGAEVRNILDFQEDFPATRVVRLETNYRSTKTILRAAQSVIDNNRDRLEKELVTDNAEGEAIAYAAAWSDSEEARLVTDRMADLLRGGVDPEQVAVFYRSHFLSRGLEVGLRQQGVPYRVVGGLSFYERREIKDLLAYLRVVMNPLDDVSMERVVNVPPRGIGRVTLDKLKARGAAGQLSLYEVTREPSLHDGLSKRAREGLAGLDRVFDEIRGVGEKSAGEALVLLIDGIDYLDYACNLGDPDDVTREENIEELIGDARVFDSEFGTGLTGYLAHVSLMTSDDRFGRSEEPSVSLMTIHAAKGLEFDHVHVVGLEDGLFPSSRSNSQQDFEEERRLMYVALTRARKTLHLSSAGSRMVQGARQPQSPSPFLSEIDGDCFAQGPVGRAPEAARWENWDVEPDAMVDQVEQLEASLSPATRVVHAEFGPGVVVRTSGRGLNTRATILFRDGRERTLLLEYEDLEIQPGGDDW